MIDIEYIFIENIRLCKYFMLQSKCTGTPEMWQNTRRFISNQFESSGTILDIGCANGFLLKCLQRWSNVPIIPFGIESDTSVYGAKYLFPIEYDAGHFEKIELEVWLNDNDNALKDFPNRFTYIYWNVWSNGFEFDNEGCEIFVKLIERVAIGGKLILGFYDSWEANDRKMNMLKKKVAINSFTLVNCPSESYSHQLLVIPVTVENLRAIQTSTCTIITSSVN